MRRISWVAAAAAILTLTGTAAALPATAAPADPSTPATGAQTVILLTPADPSGLPPTLSPVAPYTVTSAEGQYLGTKDHIRFPRPRGPQPAADLLAGHSQANQPIHPDPASPAARGVRPTADQARANRAAVAAATGTVTPAAATDYAVQDY